MTTHATVDLPSQKKGRKNRPSSEFGSIFYTEVPLFSADTRIPLQHSVQEKSRVASVPNKNNSNCSAVFTQILVYYTEDRHRALPYAYAFQMRRAVKKIRRVGPGSASDYMSICNAYNGIHFH